MEAMMMEIMNFSGVGPADFHGDASAGNWMDGLINALQSDVVQDHGSPHSSFVDVSAGSQHSPTPSSYDDTLSCIESRSSPMGGQNLATSAAAAPIVNDGWFDFAPTTMQSSGGAAGSGSMYSSVTGFSSDSRQRARTQSTNDGSVAGSVSRDGSVSSCISSSTSGSGISNYGVSSLPNNTTYMKQAGEYQYRQQTAAQKPQQQAQLRQQPTSNAWNSHSQSQRQFQQQQQIQQQQQHQQQQQQQHQHQHQQHRMRQQQFQSQQEVLPPSVEPEAEDQGLRLVQLLIACAQSIQMGDFLTAENTVMKINQTLAMAPQHSGPMSRVAAHFAEALTNRIYGSRVSPLIQSSGGMSPSALSEILHFQFYENCPYLKFSHFTANQAILEAFKGAKYVHVIDFNLNHGLQWPALIQALAMRPGGPPVLRLTGIGPPEAGDDHDSLKQIGLDLAKLAESLKVRFEFRGVVANKLDDIKDWMLEVRPGEVVAVNSMMQLHKLLYEDGCNPAGIDDVLRTVKSLNPKIVTMSEQEAKHNCPGFLDRFMEALHFYSSMFDSLEASNCPSGSEQQMLAEMYLGREINNIVACEGPERLERHETLDQWRIRLRTAGFTQIHMGPDAFKQASMLLTMFSGQGYRVQDNQGCLTLCWHDRPLIAASAWH